MKMPKITFPKFAFPNWFRKNPNAATTTPKAERVKYAGTIKFVFILISFAANVDLVLQLKTLQAVEIFEFSFKLSMIEFIALASLQTAIATTYRARMYAMLALFVFDVLFMGVGWYFKANYLFGDDKTDILLSYVGGWSIVASIGSFVAYFLISALTNADRNYTMYKTNMERMEAKHALEKSWRDVHAFDWRKVFRAMWARVPSFSFTRLIYRIAFWVEVRSQFRKFREVARTDVAHYFDSLPKPRATMSKPGASLSSDSASVDPDSVTIHANSATDLSIRATHSKVSATHPKASATATETPEKWVCANCNEPTTEGYVWCTSSKRRNCAMAVDNALERKAKKAMTDKDVAVLKKCYGTKFREKAEKYETQTA